MMLEDATPNVKPTQKGPALEKFIFLSILLSYSYFFSAGEWNQISRYDLIFTLVEPQEIEAPLFSIDPFITTPEHNFNTGDWAFHNGHYYSNKAPGSALIGALVYSFFYFIEHTILSLDVTNPIITIFNLWFINIFISALPLACSAVCFFRLSLTLTKQMSGALSATLFLYWGTLFFPYSTQTWGTTTASAFMIMGLYAHFQKDTKASFLTGLFWGLAVLTEYATAPVIAALLIYKLSRPKVQYLWAFLGGVLGPALTYMTYHAICFQNVWKPASFYSNPEFARPEQVFGMFSLLNTEALSSILFSNRLGIFLHMPALILCVLGLYFGIKTKTHKALSIAVTVSLVMMLLLNASFYGWHGGFIVGARYQIPVLALYALAFNFLPSTSLFSRLKIILIAVSMINMLVITSLTPIYAIKNAQYLGLKEYWLRFLSGEIAQHTYHVRLTFPDYKPIQTLHTFNVGELLGLHGLPTLLPLFLIVAALLFVTKRKMDKYTL